MTLEPRISLVFNGDCDEAFDVYRECLGGTVAFRLTWGASPMAQQAPVEWHGKILHATMHIGATVLHGGDAAPGSYEMPRGFQLQLNLEDESAAERVFSRLAEGGQVTVPMQQTFWALRFGAVVDRFGIPWAVNCGEPTGA
jgi:PhnB protein